jgi:hypothetical protein
LLDEEGADMNLYAILGVAVTNGDFADDFFRDPRAAVMSLNIILTNAEFLVLQDMIKRGTENGMQKVMLDMRGRICPPGMVCPWIVATREPKDCNRSEAAA